jgi:hypothetical protein
MNRVMDECSERLDRAGRLLGKCGFGDSFALAALQGGANSKAFRIDFAAGGPSLFYKEYFHHPEDPRDRLGAEFAFASFAWDQGLRTLAQPYGQDRDRYCALYAYLEGRKLRSQEITSAAIDQCLRFFQALNAGKETPQAGALANASEACFCLDDHWRCLERRLSRLEKLDGANPLDRQAAEFIHRELAPACAAYFSGARDWTAQMGMDAAAMISHSDRCLSPSDFGFHNALGSETGGLSFLDFEYAGWDDPAKTVCDFFCQPEIPVPIDFYADFANRVAATTTDPEQHRLRFDLLLPMYRLKWCCIILNDFLPGGASRRRFAVHHVDEQARKSNQLNKARLALQGFWRDSPSGRAA